MQNQISAREMYLSDTDKNLLGGGVVLEFKYLFLFYTTFKSLGMYEKGPFLLSYQYYHF